ncbi:alkylation response protein AidB-like acyl-CoA dehydrogenase [Amycolatopsis lexingtonensis]|uniref:Alkylation response protein AidB-like acyl-CoA dehydrogenase n=1 Tax=Amycolatopsis lexingtonensis TaxID=218822 RepID=A0ABR9HXV8_9PSEU|nr:acyl-CoA dehydrogenase family protein [Amycolatopsis lexingtonensis]MBE1495761.1 alkylation response protein AidB-like acyl-CoA dehydrogenase [Amycolatopsis lexingtonensis]
MSDAELSGLDAETLAMILEAIGEFADRNLPAELLLRLDHDDECPEDVVRRMCGDDLGIHLLFVPEAHGGMGAGSLDVCRVCERMAGIDLGVATSVLATALGSDPIAVGATPEQKKTWLSRMAGEGLLFAYGATEPEAGSDLGALKTVAVPVVEDGDTTGYRITGRKQWISNGGIADAYSVLANAPGGPSWFVVERDTPGFTRAKPEDKHGIRLSNTAALFLDDVEVGVDALVGGVEGRGLWQAQQVFGHTRLMVAAFGLGAGWAALDKAIAYAADRIQAGGPLSRKQGYTHKLLVPHAARLEAARAYIEETAARLDSGEQGLNTEGAIAKYLATEAGNLAADAAIQAHGGYGYTHEYLVEKIKRDVRITTIYEGTSEIMEMTISRDRWQEHLKTRGRYYHDRAAELESLDAAHPGIGAGTAALGLHVLAELLERCRTARLTRRQHVLLRLGELIAYAECAAALCRRAALAELPAKADRRFDLAELAVLARVFGREAVLRVATGGLQLVQGSVESPVADLTSALRLAEVAASQAGGLADSDALADILNSRSGGK